MVKRNSDLDIVFAALSDATRRTIIERLTHGELTAGEIAAEFSVSQPAISKHLKVLERSGLLKRNVVGREHHLRLSPRAMRRASQWLEAQQRFWDQTLDSLDDYLTSTTQEDKTL